MGTRTYLAFYALVALSALVCTLQIVVLAILMSSPAVAASAARVLGSSAGLYAPAAMGIAASLPVASFYALLWMFHTYLQATRLTTYEFLMQRDKRRREARRKKTNATDMVSKTASVRLAPENGAAGEAAHARPGDVADPPLPALDADGGGVDHHRVHEVEAHPVTKDAAVREGLTGAAAARDADGDGADPPPAADGVGPDAAADGAPPNGERSSRRSLTLA